MPPSPPSNRAPSRPPSPPRPRGPAPFARGLLAATPFLRLFALGLLGIAAAAYGLYRGLTYVHPPFLVPAAPDSGEIESPDLVPLEPSGAPAR